MKSGSAQVAALEGKVADHKESSNLGVCHAATQPPYQRRQNSLFCFNSEARLRGIGCESG